MIKNILISSLLLLTIAGFAQQGTSSPYSYYGIGDLKFNGTVDTRAMGGLGIMTDSIHLNLQNPAALPSLKLTNYLLGGTYNATTIKNSSASEKARTASLDYMALAFPIGKFGFSFGLMPYSSVGYKIRKTEPTRNSNYTGSGNLNKAFLATGYQITPKWSVGAEFGYQFGLTETNASVFLTNPAAQFGSRELNTSELSGVRFNTGTIYKTKFKKFDIISSITYTPGSTLKSNNTRNIAKIITNFGGNEVVVDSRNVNINDADLKMPSKFAFGSGIGLIKKWFVGFESSFQQSRDFPVQISPTAVASYQEATKFVVGGYYIPNYNSFTNYFNKVTYRAGLRFENTGLVINGQAINDSALTFGCGLPLGGSFSNINVGVELGKKGTTQSNLIQENYVNMSIGFSFNDKWFVKRKYD